METIITIFGSAIIKPSENLYKQAEETGELLAIHKFTVCSGGYGGIMEAVSKGAKSADGKTIGITLEKSPRRPNKYIDENVIMPNWIERLMELVAIGDAYLIFKGGSGTLVEIAAIIEMMNKKMMKEKLMIFYSKFWEKVIDTIKNDSAEIKKMLNKNVKFISKPDEIIELLH